MLHGAGGSVESVLGEHAEEPPRGLGRLRSVCGYDCLRRRQGPHSKPLSRSLDRNPTLPDLKVQKEIKSHIVGFREAFNLFDVSGDGTVALEEFVDTWKSFGFQVAQNTAACTMHPGT